MRNVLLIEDDLDITELIAYNLQKAGFKVHTADNANDGLIILDEVACDIILLDLMLPGLKGMDFLKIIRSKENTANIPVIIISAKNAEHDIISGLNTGADDYLPKPFSMEMLTAKVNTILRRGSSITGRSSNIIEHKGIKIDDANHKVYIDGQEIKLTHKEYELLRLFLLNPDTIFSRDRLLNSIWGYDSQSYTRTVDAHIASLRKKLLLYGDLIKSVSKTGYGLQ